MALPLPDHLPGFYAFGIAILALLGFSLKLAFWAIREVLDIRREQVESRRET